MSEINNRDFFRAYELARSIQEQMKAETTEELAIGDRVQLVDRNSHYSKVLQVGMIGTYTGSHDGLAHVRFPSHIGSYNIRRSYLRKLDPTQKTSPQDNSPQMPTGKRKLKF